MDFVVSLVPAFVFTAVVLVVKRGFSVCMAQGRSTKIILMSKWIRINRLSTKNSLFPDVQDVGGTVAVIVSGVLVYIFAALGATRFFVRRRQVRINSNRGTPE